LYPERVAEFAEALLDQRVMLRLVTGLAREREPQGDTARRRKPERRDLTRLDFVFERDTQQLRRREVAAHLIGEGGGGREAREEFGVLANQLGDEIVGIHSLTRPAVATLDPSRSAQDECTALPYIHFFCSIGAPQHLSAPAPPLVTITCELHLLQM
jgi:hypothetical protein